MVYTVYCDNELLFDPRIDELAIFEKKIALEVNKTGSFDFKIYPSHPMYDRIKRVKSSIEVYQDAYLVFRGRVLDDVQDFNNAKDVICEGDLAFLNDGIVRPYSYSGSVSGFLSYVLDEYNAQVEVAKRFILGNVTVTDPNDYITRSSITASSAWDVVNDKLIKLLGGYIRIRRSGGINYLDYLEDSTMQSLQEIKLGENLLDLNKEIKGQDIVTALIPYGAKLGNDTDERLTIAAVNGGIDYVFNQEAVDAYGWIFATKTWDDVTVGDNLLTKAAAELASRINLSVSLDVSAIDLSMTNGQIDELRFFEYVKINSPAHQLNEFMLIQKLTIDMENPQNNKLTLGTNYATFSESQLNTEKAIENVSNNVSETNTKVQNYVTEQVTTLNSNIEQSAGAIRTEVAETYTSKSELNEYKESVSTQFTQTSNDFTFTFSELRQFIDNVDGDQQTQFEEIRKFIQFLDGDIILGEVGNPLKLKIENDRIAFILNGVEGAYWANGNFYITDVRVLTSIRIGNYAFIPRSNGNLSFKWVG
ncbi:phage tail spike protein [uncultured Trichococcus sp.]|uniref:phage tail spike protein n=1 Tax=uncultured Trichococcus sp. TaxID=189665 RepID=UPI0029C7508D|nr:phage tail spike protein [uncultured Trichococcus sp.]